MQVTLRIQFFKILVPYIECHVRYSVLCYKVATHSLRDLDVGHGIKTAAVHSGIQGTKGFIALGPDVASVVESV